MIPTQVFLPPHAYILTSIGVAFAHSSVVKLCFTQKPERMAYVKKNIVTEGLSGKLGNNIVFRQRGGKTIVGVKPVKTNREPSEAQKEHHRKFRAASQYGRQALRDDTLRADYERQAKNGQNAYNVAIADYLNLPHIAEVDLNAYTGARGHQVVMKITDDYLVADVQVAIYSKSGTLLEQGTAELHDNGMDWVYTTQKANAQPSGSKLVVRASDLPGNTTEKEAVVG